MAANQEGIVSRRQMEACGLSDGQLERWVADARIHPVFRGVYVLGRPSVPPRARIRAAALACPGAVISHRSAAWLLGIRETSPRTIDLICPDQAGRKIDGIRVHKVPYPVRSECLLVAGIPCTNEARTAVDLAGTLGEPGLRELIEMAAVKRLLDIAAIDAVLASGPRRRGAPCLRRVLEEWRPIAETARHARVRSLFEARLLPLIAQAKLPIPAINARVRTAERFLEVDLVWDAERFIVEADSRRHHAIDIAFERDRRRDRELLAAGYRVLRVTWREAEREPVAVVAAIRGELQRRQPVR